MKNILFWNNQSNQYPEFPMPISNPDFWKRIEQETYCSKEYYANHIRHGLILNQYRGFSGCRMCKQHLGTKDLTDMFYIFPDKSEHYILEHDVELPMEFINHVKNFNKNITELLTKNGINYE